MRFEGSLEGYKKPVLNDKTGSPKPVFLQSCNLKTERPRLLVRSFAVLVQSSCSLFAVLGLDFQALRTGLKLQ